ncbi:MAG: helix-turn-helix domain-containing protein [Acidimicrobiia bacterium]
MTEVHESWGRRLKARRSELGLTQERLAEICSIEQSTISRIERGQVCPRDNVKWRLAGALGQTVEQLFPYPAVRPPFPTGRAS